ncbi:Uncharacterised protein [uncultured archaeon]|nr:Uncharacterised protein [uncultured archaeon]
MKKRTGLKTKISILFLIGLVLFLNILVSASADNSAADYISANYKGEWYSKGFSSFWGWKSFADTLVNTISKFTIIEQDNSFGVMLKDSSGNEIARTPYLVHYDPLTGEISGTLNYSVNGVSKNFTGKVLVNGDSNISKFIDPKSYVNKTIKQLVLDGIAKKLKVSFVGKESKTTISPDPLSTPENPMVIIEYDKYKSGDTSVIPANYSALNEDPAIINESDTNTTQTSSAQNNSNQIVIVSNQTAGNETNKTKIVNLTIINPLPALGKISIFVNETKLFSVDNKDFDTTKWYLDNKEVKTNSGYYEFRGLKPGNYNISIEIEKSSEIRNHFWNVEVKKIETTKEKSMNWLPIIIVIIVVAIILILGVIYFLKRKGNQTSTINNPAKTDISQNNSI